MKIFFIFMVCFFTSQLIAQDFGFEEFTMSGSACNQGNTTVSQATDGKTASVIFDQFNVQVPQYDGDNDNAEASQFDDAAATSSDSGVNMKLCNLNFATKIPAGQRVASVEIQFDFRGYVYLEKGLKSMFKSVLVQKKGMEIKDESKRQVLVNSGFKATSGVYDKDFYFSEKATIPVSSSCGKNKQNKIKFNLKNVIGIKSFQNKKETEKRGMMNVDSADLVMSVKMITLPCKP